MDPIGTSARRTAHAHDAAGEAPPNKARRLTAESGVGPNGSLSHSNPASPCSAPRGTITSDHAAIAAIAGNGSAADSSLLTHNHSHYQQRYQLNSGEAAAAGMGLEEGGHESQRLEVALDDGGEEQNHRTAAGRQDGGGIIIGGSGGGGGCDDALAGHHHHHNDADGGGGGGGGGHPEQEVAIEGPVTETIAAGLLALRQRRTAIEQQVIGIGCASGLILLVHHVCVVAAHVALDYLEATKKDFVERMARYLVFSRVGAFAYPPSRSSRRTSCALRHTRGQLSDVLRTGLKSNVAMYCNSQVAEWRETNAMTQEALSRLDAARALVRSLGLNANKGGMPQDHEDDAAAAAVLFGGGSGGHQGVGIGDIGDGVGGGDGGDGGGSGVGLGQDCVGLGE
ncbi:hypothetical protein VOLCADRAFT_94093 [Volvox carteri f. nagariensis]|uniref:Uncharacterized protein n=1 Tax=Volvox carteri f. nagariensis TaxID=3068 RepID=D8U3W5_VOLCA|nr:uncharacterized protein VOLCADRAFT_94093 [Volvox carteri f. nagariensis]EFJ45680.1 hypothetical protein VOLCADRAFT_94093 [Volvox carteri f. nagariensis]|eukprot:XP_002953370.1 hypothetical protein VOLCADRAFT_94093 [Volvox carteri f. nagariensis]